MAYEICEYSTAEEARDAASSGGVYLVVDPATLQQIQAAEAAGGFEGGMTGNSDGAPYTAAGHAGEPYSSVSEPGAPKEEVGDDPCAVIIEFLVERAIDIHDVIEAFAEGKIGPIFLVPKKELKKWVEDITGESTDGA